MEHQRLVDRRTTWAKAESESESCNVGLGLGLGLGLTAASPQHQTADLWSNEVTLEPSAVQAQAQARTRARTRLDAGSGPASASASASTSGLQTPQGSYMSTPQAPQGQGPAFCLPAPTLGTTMSWPPSPPLPLPLPAPLQTATLPIPDAKPRSPPPQPRPETTERQLLPTLTSPEGRDTTGANVKDGSQTKMKPKPLSYREKAPYISIGRGYWLR